MRKSNTVQPNVINLSYTPDVKENIKETCQEIAIQTESIDKEKEIQRVNTKGD